MYFATTGYTKYDKVLLADFDSWTATLNSLLKKMELDIEVQGHDAFIRSQNIMHIIIETERRSSRRVVSSTSLGRMGGKKVDNE